MVNTCGGLYNDELFPEHPTNVFSSRITDYPTTIAYGDTWSGVTYFNTVVEGQSGRIRYQADYSADAWGTLIIPQGEAPCLRVNRLVTLSFQVNLPFFGWTTLHTEYVRTYMWLAEHRGMAASLVSTRSTTVPGNDFATAISFTRMYETNIPGANPVVCDPVQRYVSHVLMAILSWRGTPLMERRRTSFRFVIHPMATSLIWTPPRMSHTRL